MKRIISGVVALLMLLALVGCDDGNGNEPTEAGLEGFQAGWSVTYMDRRRASFTKVVFAGDGISDWKDQVVADIVLCQEAQLEAAQVELNAEAILSENADLIIVSDGIGQLRAGTTALQFGTQLQQLVTELKGKVAANSVILLTGLPYMTDEALGDISLTRVAQYNAIIRAVAMGANALYVNLYRAQGMRDWTLSEDGATLNDVGKMLVSGEVMQELLANCSCLDQGSGGPRFYTKLTEKAPSATKLELFKTTALDEELQELLLSGYVGVDLSLYTCLSLAEQSAVRSELLEADRSGVSNYLEADVLLNTIVMQVMERADITSIMTEAKVRYVAVGDSISYGTGAKNRETDGYVPLFAKMFSTAQGTELRLINNAISGTRMSTEHNDGAFPAAKDTPGSYIVPYEPDIITIAYGTNDRTAGTTLDTFVTDYRNYLTVVKEECPDAIIILCGLPWSRTQTSRDCVYQKWNNSIKALAEEFDVIYCDTFDDMYGTSWLLADNVHPTNSGYRVMAHALLRTMNLYVDFSDITAKN